MQMNGIIYRWLNSLRASPAVSFPLFRCHKRMQSLSVSASRSITDHPLWSPICWWWALLPYVCASVKMPSECHIPSLVWSLREKKKWIKSIDYIYKCPMGNLRTNFYVLQGNPLLFINFLLFKQAIDLLFN